MKWKKLGLIFCPQNHFDWMQSHAANPTALLLKDNTFRVFFGGRNQKNKTIIGFVDIDIRQPQNILRISNQPVLHEGIKGAFDDSGASMGCVVQYGKMQYLYYLGWNLGITVPWRNSIGLAIQMSDQEEYKRYAIAPIMDRNSCDPFSLSYPWILRENSLWKMWYGSHLSWGANQKDMKHVIKYAESRDGIHWKREGIVCVNFKSKDEYAIARPCVIKDQDKYRMWYSYRGETYRIGYAESKDGIDWQRKDDQVGIDVSKEGWDSEMIEYAHVFDHNKERYMLYNGNGYGKTGFGLAILAKR